MLKLYGWEPSFEQQILNIRNKEMKVLRTAALLNASTNFLWICSSYLVRSLTWLLCTPSNTRHDLEVKKDTAYLPSVSSILDFEKVLEKSKYLTKFSCILWLFYVLQGFKNIKYKKLTKEELLDWLKEVRLAKNHNIVLIFPQWNL